MDFDSSIQGKEVIDRLTSESDSIITIQIVKPWGEWVLMKILMRTPVKIVPGKMEEYMEAEKERVAIAERLGMPPEKRYLMVSGPGDRVNTIFYEMEWDSMAAIETFYEKMMAEIF